jgi:hypothetical protein
MELVMVAAAACGVLALALTFRRSETAHLADELLGDDVVEAGESTDLPCPWCEQPTAEDDKSCPGCGRRFAPV